MSLNSTELDRKSVSEISPSGKSAQAIAYARILATLWITFLTRNLQGTVVTHVRLLLMYGLRISGHLEALFAWVLLALVYLEKLYLRIPVLLRCISNEVVPYCPLDSRQSTSYDLWNRVDRSWREQVRQNLRVWQPPRRPQT